MGVKKTQESKETLVGPPSLPPLPRVYTANEAPCAPTAAASDRVAGAPSASLVCALGSLGGPPWLSGVPEEASPAHAVSAHMTGPTATRLITGCLGSQY